MFDALGKAIEELDIGVDGAELAAALALRDRLDVRIVEAASEFDAAELWDLDGSVSLPAWLRSNTGITQREGHRIQRMAQRMRELPTYAEAWVDGRLSEGKFEILAMIVTDRTAPFFADHEDVIRPTLERIALHHVARYLNRWQARAKAELDRNDPDEPPEEPKRSVHLSPMLDGRGRLDGDLDPEAHEIVKTALRLAEAPDVPGDRIRLGSERRADALVDVCRFFLDHQSTRTGGRHRPHVNVVLDLNDVVGRRAGETLGGLPLDGPTLRKLLCDAGIHRVVTDGPSTILDYGRTTRTIPPAVYTSLVLRDLGCRFPGCDRPPEWCEGHHVQPWEEGGSTCLSNLVLLCSRHHHRVHLPGWALKLLPDATVEVTARDGTVRTGDPPPRC
ncbi:MAG: DUF222 domain-containing protein [Acidimicrobiales bacterium]